MTGKQSGVVLVASLDDAIEVADAYAAEHLEIQTRDAAAVAGRISNAGAVFVGPFSPVSLGDYCAGSNHVLPTGGSARFSAGLSAMTFLRQMQVIDYSRDALSRGGAARAGAVRRRGPAGARRGRFRAVRTRCELA